VPLVEQNGGHHVAHIVGVDPRLGAATWRRDLDPLDTCVRQDRVERGRELTGRSRTRK